MILRTVTGTIKKTDGSLWAGASITFTPFAMQNSAGVTVPIEPVSVITNDNGLFTAELFTLETSYLRYFVDLPSGEKYQFDLPDGVGSVTLAELFTAIVIAPEPTASSILLGLINAHAAVKATALQLGHVKIDGSTITIDANGVISSTASGGTWGSITGSIASQTDLQAALAAKVNKTGNETIDGVKTFSSSPVIPTPTTDFQAATKGYVDVSSQGFVGSLAVGGTGTISPTASAFNYAVVRLTGVLTGNRTVNWPVTAGVRQTAIFWNDTSGDFQLYVKATPEAAGIVRVPGNGQAILINDGTKVIDVTAAVSRVPFYCLEFDGTPQSVDFGTFYTFYTPLGDCLYEGYFKILPGGGSAKYDWSEGYGGAHAMLRNSVNGNTVRELTITNATNTTPIVITTSVNHGFVTGNSLLYIRGVLGNTAANGSVPVITVISPQTFSINGSVGNGAYISGGRTGSMVSWTADDVPYVNQWHHSATGISDGAIVHYYDGVPVASTPFIGDRVCPDVGGNGRGFMGGSDHNNYIGRIAQYRIFENGNPNNAGILGGANNLAAFVPEVVFGGESNGFVPSLLVDFYRPEQIITDKSAGYPLGKNRPGKIRGTGGTVLSNRSSYPGPQYVADNDAPNALGLVAPVQPAGKVYTPLAVPSGALVFDSVQRKNSTYTFDGLGGIGSTEGGSLGPLAWIQPGPAGGVKPFGILNEKFVYLENNNLEAFARVPCGQANLDIRVSRTAGGSYGMGVSTGLIFRYVDDLNYCFVTMNGTARDTQYILIGKIIAGAITTMTGHGTAAPAAWEVLRVLTKSDGTYSVYCDATLIVSSTLATNAAGTGAGIGLHGNPASYNFGKQGAGLRMRYRNFTVFANP